MDVREWIDTVLNGPNTQWAMGIHTHQTTSGPIVDDDSFTSGETVKKSLNSFEIEFTKKLRNTKASSTFHTNKCNWLA